MINLPLVSIIIPTYNRAHFIGETLDSILAQTYENWECIVIDDQSTDYTRELMEFYCEKEFRLKYYHRPNDRPKGANACRNFGFEISNGEFVNWFDDDDIMLKSFIKKKLYKFNSSINMVICKGYYTEENLSIEGEMCMENELDLFKSFVLWNNHIITNSILFKKSYLVGEELFSNDIERGQEAEFFSRIFFQIPRKSYKFLKTPLFLYRQHNESKTYRDLEYVKKYKSSQSRIIIENLKKSVILRDSELIQYLYNILIHFFFRGLENYHFTNSRFILNNLISQTWKLNKKLSLELLFLGNYSLIFKKGRYRIRKILKNSKIIKGV